MINHCQADLADNPAFFIGNRLVWQAAGTSAPACVAGAGADVTRIRRHRWPTEVYHAEGKAAGLDEYQLWDFNANSR